MTNELSLKNLIDLSDSLENRLTSYFTLYFTVLLGVFGWIFTVKPEFQIFEALALFLAMIGFFGANLWGIVAIVLRLRAIEQEIASMVANSNISTKQLKKELSLGFLPGRLYIILFIHLVADIGMLLIILYRAF